MSLLIGVAAILTPLVFQSLILYFFIFAKLSESIKEHWVNIVLFSVLNVISLILLVQFMFINGMSVTSEYLSLGTTVIKVLTIIFAIWLTGFLTKMVEENSINLTNQIFRYLGVFLLSIKLAFVSISCAGPMIGTMFVSGNNPNMAMSLLGFSFGVVIPFILIIGLLGSFTYNKIRNKKWIKITQPIIGIFLIISAVYSLSII